MSIHCIKESNITYLCKYCFRERNGLRIVKSNVLFSIYSFMVSLFCHQLSYYSLVTEGILHILNGLKIVLTEQIVSH